MNELKRIKGLERLYEGKQPWEDRHPDLVPDTWGGPKGFLTSIAWEGAMELQAAEALYDFVREEAKRCGRPVFVGETGCSDGLSSLMIARALYDSSGGHLWTCEHSRTRSDGKPRPWPKVFGELGLRSYITPCVGDSRSIATWQQPVERTDEWSADVAAGFIPLPDQLDLLFLDSDHTLNQVLAEWELLGPRLRPDGLLLMHDVVIFAEVAQAAKLIAMDMNVEMTLSERSCRGLAAIRKLL